MITEQLVILYLKNKDNSLYLDILISSYNFLVL